MKPHFRKHISSMLLAVVVPHTVAADNIIRTTAPISKLSSPVEKFVEIDPLVSDWINHGPERGCTSKAPGVENIFVGAVFSQLKENCVQDQIRTIQAREQSAVSGEIRNKGEPIEESREIATTGIEEAVGTGASTCFFRYPGAYANGASYMITRVSDNRNASFALNEFGISSGGGGAFPATGARQFSIGEWYVYEGVTVGEYLKDGEMWNIKAICVKPKS